MLEPPASDVPMRQCALVARTIEFGDREPEAGPALLVRGAMELVEHPVQLVRWDSGAAAAAPARWERRRAGRS